MDITVELSESVADELDEEARLQGFDDRDAYLRWIIAHRPMSELATKEAPALASRLSELEERVKILERQAGLDTPTNPDTDLGDSTSTPSGDLSTEPAPASPESSSMTDPDTTKPDDVVSQTANDHDDDDNDENEAQDDDIAEAIGDVSLEDEES